MLKGCTRTAAAPSRSAWTAYELRPAPARPTPSSARRLLPVPVREERRDLRSNGEAPPRIAGRKQALPGRRYVAPPRRGSGVESRGRSRVESGLAVLLRTRCLFPALLELPKPERAPVITWGSSRGKQRWLRRERRPRLRTDCASSGGRKPEPAGRARLGQRYRTSTGSFPLRRKKAKEVF